MGNAKRYTGSHMSERVAAFVSVGRRVRKLTASGAVEHDQDDAREHGYGQACHGIRWGAVAAMQARTPRLASGWRRVVRQRSRRLDGGNRVLENQVVAAVDLDDHRESIEALDDGIEPPAVHQLQRDDQPIATSLVEEDVLDVGLSR